VVDDNGGGRVLGDELERFGQGDANQAVGIQEAEDVGLLLQVGAGGVAPAIALAAVGVEAKLAADLLLGNLGQRLGGRGGQAAQEVTL
jgi:hypothetical protein